MKDNGKYLKNDGNGNQNISPDENKLPLNINSELIENKESTYAFRWEATSENRSDNKSHSWLHTLIIAISLLIAFSILCFTVIYDTRKEDNSSKTPNETQKAQDTEAGKTIFIKEYDDTSGTLTPQQIYAHSLPSVISIKASNDTFEGIGTGFVFDENGYIATANHVISGMTKIKVISYDQKEYDATVVGSDELTDLALLKIESNELLPLEFGASSSLVAGDELIVIGTPASLEFAGTMSSGNVSFVDRSISIYNEDNKSIKKKMKLIQTTAALNRGNSGGPVFDVYGKVVGIVTMKLGNNFEGISFMIPSDGAYPILCDMRDGIELSSSKKSAVASYAAKLGIKAESHIDSSYAGVKIIEFFSPDCDAAKKLKIGDVILSINETPIKDTSALRDTVSKYAPEERVSVTVYRSGQLLTFSIILTE